VRSLFARERAKTSFFAGPQKDKTQNRREFNVTSLSCLRPARPIEKNSFISHTSLFVQFDVNIFKREHLNMSSQTLSMMMANVRISSATGTSKSTTTTTTPRAASLSAKHANGNSKVFYANSLSLNKSRDSVATFSISASGSGTKKGLYQFVERVNSPQMKDDLIPFRVGMTVKVGVTVTEGNKSRVQPYEGLIIGIHRAGVASTITVRKSLQGFGVERIFPIHSPLCSFQEVRGAGKPIARRSKLYYLRERVGKNAKLKSRFVAKKEGLSRWQVKQNALIAEKEAAAAEAARVQAEIEAKAKAEEERLQAEAEAKAAAEAKAKEEEAAAAAAEAAAAEAAAPAEEAAPEAEAAPAEEAAPETEEGSA
jgi:ribosomal protein L19